MPWVAQDFAVAQTDIELVAAPGAGKAIELLAWKFSTDTAQALTLEDGDGTLVDKQYAAANGGQIARMGFDSANDDYDNGARLVANKSLTFTSAAAGNVSVGVLYSIVDA